MIGDLRSILIADIVSGELLGTFALDGWSRLATRYEVSTAALRLVMAELQELGLVTVDRSEMRVADQESWHLLAPAVFPELDQPRGRDAIAAYMEARRIVDAELCALAAQRRCADDIDELSHVIRLIAAVTKASTEAPGPRRRFEAADERLRCTIARAARNRHLAAVSARLRRRMHDADGITRRARACPVSGSILNALVDAIRRGDPEEALRAAQDEIDLLERWVWRTLAGLRRDR